MIWIICSLASIELVPDGPYITPVLITISIGLQCALIFLENFPRLKKKATDYQLLNEVDEESAEDSAGYLEQITFSWLNPLIREGYKRPLSPDDLPNVSNVHSAKTWGNAFDKVWSEEILKQKPSIVYAFIKCFGSQFAFAGVFKLFQDLLQFLQPKLLALLMAFVSSYSDANSANHQNVNIGFLIAFAMFFVAVTQSVLLHQYVNHCVMTAMHVRTATNQAIYQKAMKLSNAARQNKKVGDVINHISVDTQKFSELASSLHLVWSGPLQIFIAIYLLYNQLGNAVFVGVFIMIIMIPVNGYFALKMKKLQKAQMSNKDERIKLIDDILNGIKVIKLYAWENLFLDSVYSVRDKELGNLKRVGLISAIQTLTFDTTPFLVAFMTFATFALTSNTPLTPEKIFVSITLFNLLQFPLSAFPGVISATIEASVSTGRVQEFLLSEEKSPYVKKIDHESVRNTEETLIKVKNSSFKWEKDGEISLKNLNFEVKSKSLFAIIGKVGSGKSSAISAILGEMYLLEDYQSEVSIRGSVAYVGQQAWIMNATIRDNILFYKTFDQSLYDKTLEACCLLPDLEVFPGGDMTEIGERGINLSGGQKQRVALARAVYANCDIYLLDDPLSAVDAHISRLLFENVIGPSSMLKEKARLFVTHAVQYISECDYAIVMENGRIEEGPVKVQSAITAKKGKIWDVVTEYSHNNTHDERKLASKESMNVTTMKDKVSLSKKEETTQGSVKWSVYLTYAKSCSYYAVMIVLVSMIISQGSSISISVWLKHWGNANMTHAGNDETSKYLAVYGLLGLLTACLTFAQVIILWIFCAIRSAKYIHSQVLNAVMNSPIAFFETTPMGRIINRFSKDILTVDEALPGFFLKYLRMLFSVLSTLLVISTSTPLFLLVVFPLSITYFLIQRYYIGSSRELRRLESTSKSPIISHISETINGITTIRAFDRTEQFLSENESKINYNLKAFYPSMVSNRWLALRLEFIGALVILFSALFGIFGAVYFKNIDAGTIGLSISYALTVTLQLNFFVRLATLVETNIVSVERLKEYMELPSEEPINFNFSNYSWPSSGSIEFKNYSCRYRGNTELVLKNISFFVNSGEKIGIVGRSGAGKSTIMSAIFRLIEGSDGSIKIDGVDIRNVNLSRLRSEITSIPQDPVLFASSLRKNLDPFNRYSDSDIWNVLECVSLKSKIQSFPESLEIKVLTNGENFSLGERQLLCLARAILRKSKVLVFDEITAAVDVKTDELIQETIRKELKDCTVLTIAHRIETILKSDKILVMEDGKVAEFATPNQLLEDSSSKFYSLVKRSGHMFVEN